MAVAPVRPTTAPAAAQGPNQAPPNRCQAHWRPLYRPSAARGHSEGIAAIARNSLMSGAEEGVWDPAEDMSRLFGGQESGEGEPLLQKREAAPEPPATGWRWVAEVFRKVRTANIVFFSVSYRIYTKHFR